MLQHILIMALFAFFVGGIQLLLKIEKKQPVNEPQVEEEPVKKAV